jgi:hypothetical protein
MKIYSFSPFDDFIDEAVDACTYGLRSWAVCLAISKQRHIFVF